MRITQLLFYKVLFNIHSTTIYRHWMATRWILHPIGKRKLSNVFLTHSCSPFEGVSWSAAQGNRTWKNRGLSCQKEDKFEYRIAEMTVRERQNTAERKAAQEATNIWVTVPQVWSNLNRYTMRLWEWKSSMARSLRE